MFRKQGATIYISVGFLFCHAPASRHGAAQYTGDLEFIFYGHHLDRAIPIIQRPYIVWWHPYLRGCMIGDSSKPRDSTRGSTHSRKSTKILGIRSTLEACSWKLDVAARNDKTASRSTVAVITSTSWTVLLFSKLNKLFCGYFDPEKIFLDNKNK